MTIVKFPFATSRRAFARRPRRSKNGTPEERAAKSAAATGYAAPVVEMPLPTVPRVIPTAPHADPIFAAIEAHRRAMAAYDAAVEVSSALRDGTPEHTAAQAITERTSDEVDEVGTNLADVQPATIAGIAALLAHIIECVDEKASGEAFDGANWRLPHVVTCDDGSEEHFMLRLLCSIETTLRSLTATHDDDFVELYKSMGPDAKSFVRAAIRDAVSTCQRAEGKPA